MSAEDGIRRDLRRMLPEFTAALEEFRDAFSRHRDPVPDITYGEAMLTMIVPFVNTYVEEIRKDLDELDADELAALYSVVSPVVDMRIEAVRNERTRRRGRRR